jgi:hypothetical protein
MKNITKRQAEASLKAVAKKFGADADGPQLVKDHQGWYSDHAWAIVWEGGPYDWPQLLGGGIDEELLNGIYPEFEPDLSKAIKKASRGAVEFPQGVWAEAINGYSIALYPLN